MNFYIAISCLLALAAFTEADGSLGGPVYAPGHASVDYYAYPSYAFEYAVKDPQTGDNKAQWEKRDGDVVKGSYQLVEPDGSVRVVEYYADDKTGFNAIVKRLGPSVHPAVVPATPIYKAPIPILSSGSIAPITVGPVAKLGGLGGAPLLTGSLLGGAYSSTSVYKDVGLPGIKSVAAVAPPPVYLPEPIYTGPIVKSAPILPASLPLPIIKSVPILPEPLPLPIIKSAPILPASFLPAPYPAPIAKTTILPAPIINVGPILSPLKTNLGLPSLASYGDGLKYPLVGGASLDGAYGKGYLGGLDDAYTSPLLGLKH